jgi:DNA-binding XRE family transcriptional regulator
MGDFLSLVRGDRQVESKDLSVGDRIYAARHGNDQKHPDYVSQPELADAIGKTRASASNYETGKYLPQLSIFRAISRKLRTPVADLLSRQPPDEIKITDPEVIRLVWAYYALSPAQGSAALRVIRTLRAAAPTKG